MSQYLSRWGGKRMLHVRETSRRLSTSWTEKSFLRCVGDAGKAGLRHAPSITFHQKLNNIEEIERGQSRTRMPDERTLYEHLISCLLMRVVK